MKSALIVVLVALCGVAFAFPAAQQQERIDLSTLLNLLPHDSNILGTLGHLTQGTSLGTIMNILNILNTIHQIGGNISAIPQDILNALNSTVALLGGATGNLTETLLHQVTQGKRGVQLF